MNPSVWLVLGVSLIGDVTVFICSTFLLLNKKVVRWLTIYATPFAAGALLAAAFLDFLHDGVEHYEPLIVLIAALIGVIFFFLLEGWLHWFHHHSVEPYEAKGAHKQPHADPVVVLVTAGNWLHNFIDGAAIAGAFLINPSSGVITTLVVALHEIPREMADSGYLLKSGWDRSKVIGVHGIAIVVTAIGTVGFYLTAQSRSSLIAWLLGSTAGFFIYVAASDIFPSINQGRTKSRLLDLQSMLVVFGAASVGTIIVIAHHFID